MLVRRHGLETRHFPVFQITWQEGNTYRSRLIVGLLQIRAAHRTDSVDITYLVAAVPATSRPGFGSGHCREPVDTILFANLNKRHSN